MRTLYFCPVVSSFFLSFSSPNLSGRRLDVCHTCTHGVALVRIYDAGLKRAARGSLKIQDAKIVKNSSSGHHRTNCRAISLHLRHVSTIGKTLIKQQYLPICAHNMGNIGPLTAEIGSVVSGTPPNVNGFRVLAALLHGTLVVGVSQTLRR